MNSQKKQPIGVFDSGVGGLTVLRHLIHTLPGEEFVYLGDTARVPYGNKSPETIRHYTSQCVHFLLGLDVKAIVIACNTASALALDLAQSISPVPVIGMISPAAKAAISLSSNGNIGIIGTRATISSHAYEKAINEEAKKVSHAVEVFGKACPLFVPLAEEDWTKHKASELIAHEYLDHFSELNIDTLVLGCTHYPLLRNLIQDTLPSVQLLDCGESAARELASILQITTPHNPPQKPAITMYTTDAVYAFSIIAERCLGFPLNDPIRISTESLEQHES